MISLDPAFGFKLTLNELALIFHSLAKGETLNEISEVLTENRPSKDPVQKKTIIQAVYRLAPIVTRYITNC